jgi:hypothetical protein
MRLLIILVCSVILVCGVILFVARRPAFSDYNNDNDGDGWSDGFEIEIGTSLASRCAPEGQEWIDAWPPDFTLDGAVTAADISAIGTVIGRSHDEWPVARWDITPEPFGDGAITGADLSKVAGLIGEQC